MFKGQIRLSAPPQTEALIPAYSSAEAQAVMSQFTLLALPVLVPSLPYASLAQEAGTSAHMTDKTFLSGHGPSVLTRMRGGAGSTEPRRTRPAVCFSEAVLLF